MNSIEHPEQGTEITIDGRRFDVPADRQWTAADLLRLAGLDPRGYDLAEVRGHGELVRFEDAQIVALHRDEKFVSVRQTAPVA